MKKQLISILLILGIANFSISFAQNPMTADHVKLKTDSIIIQPTAKAIQEISVTKFSRLSNDLTARITAPKKDQNNEACAIIKIVTKDKSLFFEPDALGIIAREDQPGEIWLYVPHGAKRITIKHERFGIIRNYFYNEPIDKATVYELVLQVPELQNNSNTGGESTTQRNNQQFLVMNVFPTDAQLFINDSLCSYKNGTYSGIFPLGEYKYRLTKPHYSESSGVFKITSEHPTILAINIEPDYGFLSVKSNKKSQIQINKESIFTTPYLSDTLKCGTYHIRAERKNYIPQEQNIVLNPTQNQEIYFKLKKINAKPNLFLLPHFSFTIDGGSYNSYGLFVGVGRKYGGYLNFRTNGKFSNNTERVFSTETNEYYYYEKPYQVRYTISGGVMIQTFKFLYIYGGVGYGMNQLSDEKRYMGEVGLIGRYKKLALSAGINSDNAFDYKELSFGIGYVFGK